MTSKGGIGHKVFGVFLIKETLIVGGKINLSTKTILLFPSQPIPFTNTSKTFLKYPLKLVSFPF